MRSILNSLAFGIITVFVGNYATPVFAEAVQPSTRATELQQLPPAWIGDIPGTIKTLNLAFDGNSVYAIYQSYDRCSSGQTKRCLGYSHIKDRQITTPDITLDGSLTHDLPITTGKRGEVYIPVTDFMKMNASLYRYRPLDNTKELLFQTRSMSMENYLLSNDFNDLYVATKEGYQNNSGIITAIDISSPDGPKSKWSEKNMPIWAQNATLSADQKQILYQYAMASSRSNEAYLISTEDGQTIARDAALITGMHTSAYEHASQGTAIYGSFFPSSTGNVDDCYFRKMKMTENSVGELLWAVKVVPECKNGINSINAVALDNQEDGFVYAGLSDTIHAYSRQNGEPQFQVSAPEGSKFEGNIIFDSKGLGYRKVIFTTGGGGILVFSPQPADGIRSRLLTARTEAVSITDPVIIERSLYVGFDKRIYEFDLDAPASKDREAVFKLDDTNFSVFPDDQVTQLTWLVKENNIVVERGHFDIDPRDYPDKKISRYQWPLELSTVINKQSKYIKAGALVNGTITPLASQYKNQLWRPQNSDFPLEIEVNQEAICFKCESRRFTLYDGGKRICSAGDMPPNATLTIKAVSSWKPSKEWSYTLRKGEEGQYTWPQRLAEHINNSQEDINSSGLSIRIGERRDDNKGLFEPLYSYYRNKIWVKGAYDYTLEFIFPEGSNSTIAAACP